MNSNDEGLARMKTDELECCVSATFPPQFWPITSAACGEFGEFRERRAGYSPRRIFDPPARFFFFPPETKPRRNQRATGNHRLSSVLGLFGFFGSTLYCPPSTYCGLRPPPPNAASDFALSGYAATSRGDPHHRKMPRRCLASARLAHPRHGG